MIPETLGNLMFITKNYSVLIKNTETFTGAEKFRLLTLGKAYAGVAKLSLRNCHVQFHKFDCE
jgi:hypothetical protein